LCNQRFAQADRCGDVLGRFAYALLKLGQRRGEFPLNGNLCCRGGLVLFPCAVSDLPVRSHNHCGQNQYENRKRQAKGALLLQQRACDA